MDKNTSQSLICIKHKTGTENEVQFAWVTDSMATDDTGNNNHNAWARGGGGVGGALPYMG